MNVKDVFPGIRINPATIMKMVVNQDYIQELVRRFEKQQSAQQPDLREKKEVACKYCNLEQGFLCKKHALEDRIKTRTNWVLVSNYVNTDFVVGPFVSQTDIVFIGNETSEGYTVLAINCPYINITDDNEGKPNFSYTEKIVPFTFTGINVNCYQPGVQRADFMDVLKNKQLEFSFVSNDTVYKMVLTHKGYASEIFEKKTYKKIEDAISEERLMALSNAVDEYEKEQLHNGEDDEIDFDVHNSEDGDES